MPDAIAPRSMSLGRRALHGMIMMLAQNAVGRVTSLASQLLLAALLLPADFGLIGLTYTVTTIVAAVTNVGVEDVVLQRRRTLYHWTGAVFWIALCASAAAGLLVVCVAPAAAAAYHAPPLVSLLAVLALSMPLSALSSVPAMILRARMRFGVFAVYGTVETIIQAVMTVGLAWSGYGAFSFVIPMPVLAVVRAIIWWSLIGARPSLHPQRKRWKYLVRNTAASFASKLLVTLIGQGDYIVLGLLATQSAVGRYYFAFRLAAQPVWILAGNLSGVLYPTLIQLKSDPERQGRAALNSCIMLSYCVIPSAVLQAALAPPILMTFFGQKWQDSILVVQLLSVGLALDAASWIAGALLAARGEFVAGLRVVMVQAPIFFLFVTIGAVLDQATGVACAACLFYAVTQPAYVHYVFRRVGVSVREVTLIYLKPAVLAASAVGIAVLISRLAYPLLGMPLVRAAIVGVAAIALYGVLVRQFAAPVWSQVTRQIRSTFGRDVAA